jgi:hypothetical protein
MSLALVGLKLSQLTLLCSACIHWDVLHQLRVRMSLHCGHPPVCELVITLLADGQCRITASLNRKPCLHLQALISPLTGILGDKFNRIILVVVGTFLWGIMTAAIGLSTTLSQV